MMESSSSPQNDVEGPLARVEVVTDAEEEELELWGCYKDHRILKLTSLLLSTTTYRAARIAPPPSEDHNEHTFEEDIVECSICLVPLETGDRIGKLSCRHPMHVACLKPWLQRQNACPLCKRLKVAQPKYTKESEDTTPGGVNDSSNTRRIEGSFSSDELMQESDEAVNAVPGLETLDPVGQVQDEPSNQQLEGTIESSNSHEILQEPDRDSE